MVGAKKQRRQYVLHVSKKPMGRNTTSCTNNSQRLVNLRETQHGSVKIGTTRRRRKRILKLKALQGVANGIKATSI